MPAGSQNSSITRVRPLFHKLFSKDWSGETWLPALLHLATDNKSFAESLANNVTPLKMSLLYRRPFKDRVLKAHGVDAIELEDCFECLLPPPHDFLEWLIRHPGAMTWPDNGRRCFGQTTQRLREKLFAGEVWAAEEALAALKASPPKGSARKWWAFEGFTEVDCYLETENLVLFIEGKRTEPLSSATDWYPKRNQLVRNLEVARSTAKGKTFAVMVLCEEPLAHLTDQEFIEGLPHLQELETLDMRNHYLGCVTWREACEATGVSFFELPETTEKALEDYSPKENSLDNLWVPKHLILETWQKKLAEEKRRKEIAENISSPDIVRTFGGDSTIRLSCRKGEYLLWLGCQGLFGDNYDIVDFWEFKDGDFVTITNRMCDLPSWFALHPTEASNVAVSSMKEKVEQGDYPPDIIDGPNLWRAKAGDRIVWIGTQRRNSVPWPVMSILKIAENALVVGETNKECADFLPFGAVTDENATQRYGDLFRAGVEAAERLGTPRTMSLKWSIGWV
jgi:hypothetical protein